MQMDWFGHENHCSVIVFVDLHFIFEKQRVLKSESSGANPMKVEVDAMQTSTVNSSGFDSMAFRRFGF